MTEYVSRWLAPIHVTYDDRAGRVLRVQVADECAVPDRDDDAVREIRGDGERAVADPALRERVITACEGAVWPAWEIGW